MPRIRINDLARELEVKSKSILDALLLVGVVEKKTHSSLVEEEEAKRVRAHFRAQDSAKVAGARIARGEDERKTKIDLSHISRPGDVLRAIQQKVEGAPSPAQPISARAPTRLILPQTGPRPVYRAPSSPQRSALPVSPPAPKATASAPATNRTEVCPPPTGKPTDELLFMKDEKLRQIATRDYSELRKADAVGAVKCRFILMGGLLEALLLDALLPRNKEACATKAAAKEHGRKLDEWSLATLIDVAVELDFVGRSVRNLSQQVRDFRNLIHPAFEKRKGYKVREQEAKIAEQILMLVIEDLRDRLST